MVTSVSGNSRKFCGSFIKSNTNSKMKKDLDYLTCHLKPVPLRKTSTYFSS